ncbi:hypothetical protein K449DRAFT_149063 [Hypoxylon sp. EC38]|nr:hypothetical protein K449DRAFT_149063 [Hypoxylon sp. EC38]
MRIANEDVDVLLPMPFMMEGYLNSFFPFWRISISGYDIMRCRRRRSTNRSAPG